MLRMSAARVAATATRPAGAAGLLRPLSSLAVGHTERQSHRDVLVGRIARKLASAHAPPSSIEALDDKVEFLRRLGLSKDRALAAISLHPTMLNYSEQMMESKISALYAFGLTKPMVLTVITRHPNVLGVSVDAFDTVRDWYVAQGVSPTKVPFLMTVFPQAVSVNISENMDPKLNVLRGIGVTSSQLVRILQRAPQFMTLSIERIQAQITSLKRFGLADDELAKILALCPEALSLSILNITAKIELLDDMFGTGAGVTALSVNPRILMRNGEQLRLAFAFLTEVVGLDAERLGKNTSLIMRTVDGILKPRYQFLRETQPEFDFESLPWIIRPNDWFEDAFPGYAEFLAAFDPTAPWP